MEDPQPSIIIYGINMIIEPMWVYSKSKYATQEHHLVDVDPDPKFIIPYVIPISVSLLNNHVSMLLGDDVTQYRFSNAFF
jgi:hypothetical protein